MYHATSCAPLGAFQLKFNMGIARNFMQISHTAVAVMNADFVRQAKRPQNIEFARKCLTIKTI